MEELEEELVRLFAEELEEEAVAMSARGKFASPAASPTASPTAPAASTPACTASAPPDCYLCLHGGPEPLHRNCACRGDDGQGFAHMRCLIKYVASAAKENWRLWYRCGLCKQPYYGAVLLELAKARYNMTRLAAEEDPQRLQAVDVLALALRSERDYWAALPLVSTATACRQAVF